MSFSTLKIGAAMVAALTLSACGESPQSDSKAAYDDASAQQVVNHYADIALATFSDALEGAKAMQRANQALLDAPSADTLNAARDAWRTARVPYMQTEVFRFGNAIVDEWEVQVNAWPLDEGLIDYVGNDYQAALGNVGATANIIANTSLRVGEEDLDLTKITPELLAGLNELAGSEANVATGFHAIEFLLWGQDTHGTNAGAGERPATDFSLNTQLATGGHNARRRDYLTAVTDLLVSDLEAMVAQWQPDSDNYRKALISDTAENGLRKIFFGMGSLSLGELAGQRMKVALEAHSPEDEHDCFSDNTHASHFYNQQGIVNVYLGSYRRVDGSVLTGPSLSALVAEQDAALDEKLKTHLLASTFAMQALVDSAEQHQIYFDQLIAPGNDSGAQLVRAAINALVTQTGDIERAAEALRIKGLNPDTAGQDF